MRIVVDFRMLTQGPHTVNRGVGRYTQQQIREVVRLDHDNEYILLCHPGTDPSLILPDIRSAPNVSLGTLVMSCDPDDPALNQPQNALRHTEQFQAFVAGLRADLFHLTVPVVLRNQLVLTHFDACPMVSTFYDLIPLIYPDQYLDDADLRALYFRALGGLKHSQRLIAISESARRDAQTYLGISPERVDVAYPVADPDFQVLSPETVRDILKPLRHRAPVPETFVLSVSHLHHSKNLETLLAAYGRLPERLRAKFPLVLTFLLWGESRETLIDLAALYGIHDNLVLTGEVSDMELVALYNAAAVLVHPSRYEGFGLPVIEAMKCGAPVITTTSSSLVEVGGDAAVLVDPTDTAGFASALEEVLTNSARRDTMRERGLAHAERFDPAQLGQNTLDSYRKAVKPEPRRERPPRLAIWTPLPPLESGISDYSAELIDDLAERADVEVFVDDGYLPDAVAGSKPLIHHHTAFERRQAQSPFDASIYQLGASHYHRYMLDPLRKWPGIVVLHDLVLGILLHSWLVREGRRTEFEQILARSDGRQALAAFHAAEHKARAEQPGALEAFLSEHFMLRDVVEASRALIVHFESARHVLETRYGQDAHVLPMGVDDPLRGQRGHSPFTLRAQLGLPEDAFIVGIFGILAAVKQPETSMQGFPRLLQSHANSVLLIVGAALTDEYLNQLKAVVGQLGIGDKVRFTGRVTREQYEHYLLTCDVAINLRHPSRQQMSATLIRAMAAGKPLIISDLPEWQAFPDEFCWRIKHDLQQDISTLAEYLRRLAADPAQRAHMGSAARTYYEQYHTIPQMVTAYLEVIQKVTGRVIQGVDIESRAMHVTKPIHFNKVCELEDFSDPELIETIRDVFPHEMAHFSAEFPKGAEYRKYWEIAMSVRALRSLGALHPDASILGVGAGTEATTYYLTNHARQVVATDLYLNPGAWGSFAPGFMLVEPEKVAPYPFRRERLVVQHMDGRLLHFPDDSFDGIYSSGSIEHFGGPEDIAASAYEMGRVLKPGGILTLSTEFQISGPPGGEGWPGLYLFTAATLRRLIIEASGLEPVDELDSEVSPLTLETRQDLNQIIADMDRAVEAQGAYPRVGEVIWPRYPHILQVSQGYVFGSVHVTLRKTNDYPGVSNAWAKPGRAILESIELMNREARQAMKRESALAAATADPVLAPVSGRGAMERALKKWDGVRQRTLQSRLGKRLPGPLAFAYRTALRVRGLGMAWDGQYSLYKAMIQSLNGFEARLRNLEASLASTVTRTELEHLKVELGSIAPSRRATSRAARLDGESMTALFRTLEAALPALAGAQAVEVSIQDSAAETAIVAAASYFGERMSSQGASYRFPNDLWYHLDFSAQWNRAGLLENAANKMVAGGHFILVTASENTDAPPHPRLTLITDQVVPLPGETLVRAFVYRL